MSRVEVLESLTLRFEAEGFALGVVVSPSNLLPTLRALRDAHGYRFYVCATATDRGEEIELIHGLRNLETHDVLWVKTRLSAGAPEVDSAAFLFAGAEWHERELFDLFGVVFRAHPDPRRILLPEDYVGHPLRKDFPISAPWGYRPVTRVEGKR